MAKLSKILIATLAFSGLASSVCGDFAARNLLSQRQWLDDLAENQDEIMMPSESQNFYLKPRQGRQQNDVANRRFSGNSGFDDTNSEEFGSFGSAFQARPQQPIKKRIFKRPTNQRAVRKQDGATYDSYGNRQRYRTRGYGNEEQVSRRQGSQSRFPEEQEERRSNQEQRPLRRIDLEKEAIIEDVEDVLVSAPTNQKIYKPASGPAYAPDAYEQLKPLAAPRFDPIPYPDAGDYPAEQRDIQSAVLDGANSYKPDGVYQTEDRLEFQIHGHQGPHSYRYGYDTGNGYNRSFRYEERDKDGFVKGRYGYFDQYGKLKVVNYSADPYKGFKAEGAHVPF